MLDYAETYTRRTWLPCVTQVLWANTPQRPWGPTVTRMLLLDRQAPIHADPPGRPQVRARTLRHPWVDTRRFLSIPTLVQSLHRTLTHTATLACTTSVEIRPRTITLRAIPLPRHLTLTLVRSLRRTRTPTTTLACTTSAGNRPHTIPLRVIPLPRRLTTRIMHPQPRVRTNTP
jgi:hypothetical protein